MTALYNAVGIINTVPLVNPWGYYYYIDQNEGENPTDLCAQDVVYVRRNDSTDPREHATTYYKAYLPLLKCTGGKSLFQTP